MKYYFMLQFRMLNRKMIELGIKPIFAYPLLLVVYIALAEYSFYKTNFAQYLWIVASLGVSGKLAETARVEFLERCFLDNEFQKIRILEHLVSAMPFLFFLLYKKCWIATLLLLVLSLLFATIRMSTNFNIKIPTPFYKQPFEGIVGVRKTFYVLPVIYGVGGVASMIPNVNLGVFSLILLFLVIFSFYTTPEPEYFVWSFRMNPRRFLYEKIKIAFTQSAILLGPLVILLGIVFFQNIAMLGATLCLGYVFLVVIISAKYAAYPQKMGISQGVLLALSFCFPIALFFVIPYFVMKALKRINVLLK